MALLAARALHVGQFAHHLGNTTPRQTVRTLTEQRWQSASDDGTFSHLPLLRERVFVADRDDPVTARDRLLNARPTTTRSGARKP